MAASKVLIVGAGLSGMVAGINLAREGFEVEILEGAKRIGQLEDFHPSVHGTPIHLARVSDYTGIDISPGFIPCKRLVIHIKDRPYELDTRHFYLVERGGRKTSLDYALYRLALECGVCFRFDTLVGRLDEVPEGAILATGLNRDGMELMGIPYIRGSWAYARKTLHDPAFEDCCMGWAGDYTKDYAYLSVANNLMFFLVFTRSRFEERDVERAKKHLKDTQGLECSKWVYGDGYIPRLNTRSLRLFHKRRILTGTISGMIDPFNLYGIHGALMAGKVAAMAVMDKEKALKEFQRLNRSYQRVLLLSSIIRKMPMRLSIMDYMFSNPEMISPVLKMIDDGIPGYERHWTLDALTGRRKPAKQGARRM